MVFLMYTAVLSLSTPNSVCESGGTVEVIVTLETDIERDVAIAIATADNFALGKAQSNPTRACLTGCMLPLSDGSDYTAVSITHTFASPMTSPSTFSSLVTILDNSVVEPCEDFTVTLTSSSVRTVFNGASSRSVIIHDDEGRDRK